MFHEVLQPVFRHKLNLSYESAVRHVGGGGGRWRRGMRRRGARRHRRATLYPWNLISVHFSEYFLKILIHACICIPDPQLPLDSAQICLTAPRYIHLLGKYISSYLYS